MAEFSTEIDRRAAAQARAFGQAIRERRRAMGMTQDQLALATGVGRRYLIDLEAGKATGELGRGLVVAEAVGLSVRPAVGGAGPDPSGGADLPDDLPEDLPDEDEADAASPRPF